MMQITDEMVERAAMAGRDALMHDRLNPALLAPRQAEIVVRAALTAALGDVEQLDDEKLAEDMAYAFHVGLRKGSEDPVAHDLWKLIHEADSAVYDAILYAVRGMRITAIRPAVANAQGERA